LAGRQLALDRSKREGARDDGGVFRATREPVEIAALAFAANTIERLVDRQCRRADAEGNRLTVDADAPPQAHAGRERREPCGRLTKANELAAPLPPLGDAESHDEGPGRDREHSRAHHRQYPAMFLKKMAWRTGAIWTMAGPGIASDFSRHAA